MSRLTRWVPREALYHCGLWRLENQLLEQVAQLVATQCGQCRNDGRSTSAYGELASCSASRRSSIPARWSTSRARPPDGSVAAYSRTTARWSGSSPRVELQPGPPVGGLELQQRHTDACECPCARSP